MNKKEFEALVHNHATATHDTDQEPNGVWVVTRTGHMMEVLDVAVDDTGDIILEVR